MPAPRANKTYNLANSASPLMPSPDAIPIYRPTAIDVPQKPFMCMLLSFHDFLLHVVSTSLRAKINTSMLPWRSNVLFWFPSGLAVRVSNCVCSIRLFFNLLLFTLLFPKTFMVLFAIGFLHWQV